MNTAARPDAATVADDNPSSSVAPAEAVAADTTTGVGFAATSAPAPLPKPYELIAQTAGARPKVLKAVVAIGLLDLTQMVLFGFVESTNLQLSVVSMLLFLVLGGGLLHLLWTGSRIARAGYSAFHVLQLTIIAAATLLVTGDAAQNASPTSWIGVLLSITLAVLVWLPGVSTWLKEVGVRRAPLPREHKRVLVKAAATYGFVLLMTPLLVFKALKGGVALGALAVLASPVAMVGVVVLLVQAVKLYKLRKQ